MGVSVPQIDNGDIAIGVTVKTEAGNLRLRRVGWNTEGWPKLGEGRHGGMGGEGQFLAVANGQVSDLRCATQLGINRSSRDGVARFAQQPKVQLSVDRRFTPLKE